MKNFLNSLAIVITSLSVALSAFFIAVQIDKYVSSKPIPSVKFLRLLPKEQRDSVIKQFNSSNKTN